MQLALHRLKKRLGFLISKAADWALLTGVVLIGGLGSSWYMVEAGTRLTTERLGPWVGWTSAASPNADPYTRAHFARAGTLPLSTEIARTYFARTDSDGHPLQAFCHYAVEGHDFPASWWSLQVFDEHGRMLSNAAQRYAFTSDTITLEPDGSFLVNLARDARPGNWLPIAGSGPLSLMLTLIDIKRTATTSGSGLEPQAVPTIRKTGCR
jgi:hypothetical protein